MSYAKQVLLADVQEATGACSPGAQLSWMVSSFGPYDTLDDAFDGEAGLLLDLRFRTGNGLGPTRDGSWGQTTTATANIQD